MKVSGRLTDEEFVYDDAFTAHREVRTSEAQHFRYLICEYCDTSNAHRSDDRSD